MPHETSQEHHPLEIKARRPPRVEGRPPPGESSMQPRTIQETASASPDQDPLLAACHAIGVPTSITGMFECMAVAEEAIQDGMQRHPRHAQAINDAFLVLKPTRILSDKPLDLYRGHTQELVERVAAGDDLSEPTNAEVCAFITQMSLHAPMQHEVVNVYIDAFQHAMPGHVHLLDGVEVRESWTGSMHEKRAEIHRELKAVMLKKERGHERFA